MSFHQQRGREALAPGTSCHCCRGWVRANLLLTYHGCKGASLCYFLPSPPYSIWSKDNRHRRRRRQAELEECSPRLLYIQPWSRCHRRNHCSRLSSRCRCRVWYTCGTGSEDCWCLHRQKSKTSSLDFLWINL